MRNIQAISVAETVTLRPDSVSQAPENAESQKVARAFAERSVHVQFTRQAGWLPAFANGEIRERSVHIRSSGDFS